MADDNKKRNPYADMGLMIAVTIILVMIIKTLLFANTFNSWECILLILAAVAYLFVTKKYDSESDIIKHSTTALVCITAFALTSLAFFDHKSSPKMHAFEGAKTDTLAEEEFIQRKDPQIEKIDTDTVITTVIDSLAEEAVEEILEEGEVPTQDQQTEESSATEE